MYAFSIILFTGVDWLPSFLLMAKARMYGNLNEDIINKVKKTQQLEFLCLRLLFGLSSWGEFLAGNSLGRVFAIKGNRRE